jgi:hypothetical protein
MDDLTSSALSWPAVAATTPVTMVPMVIWAMAMVTMGVS